MINYWGGGCEIIITIKSFLKQFDEIEKVFRWHGHTCSKCFFKMLNHDNDMHQNVYNQT